MFDRIVKLASKLDEAGFEQKAALLDVLIKEAQAVIAPEFVEGAPDVDLQEVPVTDAPRNLQPVAPAVTNRPNVNEIREKIIFDSVMNRVTGLNVPILEYFLRDDIKQSIEKLSAELLKVQALEAGSAAQIDALRKIRNEFDELDPWNTSRPQDKLAFLGEVVKLADIVKQYVPMFNQPNYSEDSIIDGFVKQLKKGNYLVELNKAKKSL